MQRKLLLLLLVCGAVSGSVTCPDGQKTCPDRQTCCLTEQGYKCCPYPNAVCCADRAHCCPYGFMCDLTTQMCERSWGNLLLPRDEAPLAVKQTPLQTAPPSVDQAPPSVDQAPPSLDQAPPSVIYCDNVFTCPNGFTCCRHPAGGWSCCPYSPARCCLDGYHCCPYGYDCDRTYTHCIRQGVPHPFSRPSALAADPVDVLHQVSPASTQPAERAPPSVIYCDNVFTCPNGFTCCRHPAGGWSCCPYSPARCCLDGYHCCPYGYDCDRTYTHCIMQGVPHPFSRPSALAADPVDVLHQVSAASTQPAEWTLAALGEEPVVQEGGIIHCDAQFYCPKGSSCCRSQGQQWSCCPYPLGVCCADGRHCCEYGFTCDPTYYVCRKMPQTL